MYNYRIDKFKRPTAAVAFDNNSTSVYISERTRKSDKPHTRTNNKLSNDISKL